MRAKWYDIGLALKVSVGTLDSINLEAQSRSDKLRETLKVWLKTAKQPSWQDVVAVLESCVVGEPKLASDIKAKQPTTAQLYSLVEQESQELRTRDQESHRRMDTLQQELRESQREIKELTQKVEENQQQLPPLTIQVVSSNQPNQTHRQQIHVGLSQPVLGSTPLGLTRIASHPYSN